MTNRVCVIVKGLRTSTAPSTSPSLLSSPFALSHPLYGSRFRVHRHTRPRPCPCPPVAASYTLVLVVCVLSFD